jgi:hypothetical protein
MAMDREAEVEPTGTGGVRDSGDSEDLLVRQAMPGTL